MPVGRFVLDVHGESRTLWPANDALCAALQVINHLQDCAKDYRELNRVYIPEPMLTGIGVEALAQDKGTNPALTGVISRTLRGKMPSCWRPHAPLPAASRMEDWRWKST